VIGLSQLAWIYALLAVSLLLMVLGTVLFMSSFSNMLLAQSLRRMRWAWIVAMVASVPLCVAGEIMWDALDWAR